MARELVRHAREKFPEVRKQYQASLAAHEIRAPLRIDVKNILENVRSALEYAARHLHTAVLKGSAEAKVYFPIASRGARRVDFASLANRAVPGVVGRPDVIAELAACQEFADTRNGWLPDLATLTNENKHDQLTPQARVETQRVKAEIDAGAVIWNPAGIKFGEGVYIGGVPVDPRTQMPVPDSRVRVTRETWVDFQFESLKRSVLPFLEECVLGTEGILDRIEKLVR